MSVIHKRLDPPEYSNRTIRRAIASTVVTDYNVYKLKKVYTLQCARTS
jgi:hypothetical protein